MVLRVGILCTAEIAKKNAIAIARAAGVELTVVGSRTIDRANEFVATLRSLGAGLAARAVAGYDAVIASEDVDCVYVPLPAALHVEWVQKAALNGKHIVLEKPIAMTVRDTRLIDEAVRLAGPLKRVQYIDGTMWMHHVRTARMADAVKRDIGAVRHIHASASFTGDDAFFAHDVRCKPDLDGLGALGDLGWYCIRAILWAVEYADPCRVAASPVCKRNDAGVLMRCSAVLEFDDGITASFDCAFDAALHYVFTVTGTRGEVLCDDFIIPRRGPGVFRVRRDPDFTQTAMDMTDTSEEQQVESRKTQETLMWECMAGLAAKDGQPDYFWLDISVKTQMIMLAVVASLESGGAIDYTSWLNKVTSTDPLAD